MKKKIDPLFALSLIVLVLGLCALAFAYAPVQSCAKAETTSSGSVSNSDFVIGTTTEAKFWPSSSALLNGSFIYSEIVGYMVKGLPKVSDFSALASTSPIHYVVDVRFSGLVNGSNYFVTTSIEFFNRLGDLDVSAFSVGMSAHYDDLDLNLYTDYIFTGDMEAYNQFCNKSFASRFFVFSAPVSVSYTFKEGDAEVTSETMSDNYKQFLSLVNDCVAFSPVDFGAYGDSLLSGSGDFSDLQEQYNALQLQYRELLYDYSLVAPSGTSIIQWGTAFKFSPVFGETSLPADSSVYYEGAYMFGSAATTKGFVDFYDVEADWSTEKKGYYPSDISLGKYVCFGLPFGTTICPNDTLTYKFASPLKTKMMLGVYDSERKTVYHKAFLNDVSSVTFNAFDYRVSNDSDMIIFYAFVSESNSTAYDYLVPGGVDTLHVSTSSGQNSYDAGFNAGVVSVKFQYESQLQAAIENARQKGFAEAEAMFNKGDSDYSFFGLISAVIDAPIKAIRGLLNFDILGVNMFAFVSSLFSLAVILMLIKFILGTRGI